MPATPLPARFMLPHAQPLLPVASAIGTWLLAPTATLTGTLVAFAVIKSPLVVIGERLVKAPIAVLELDPPFATGRIPATPADSETCSQSRPLAAAPFAVRT